MARYRRKFQVEVLTMAGRRVMADAVYVGFAASDGQVGILGGHSPLIAKVGVAGPAAEIQNPRPGRKSVSQAGNVRAISLN